MREGSSKFPAFPTAGDTKGPQPPGSPRYCEEKNAVIAKMASKRNPFCGDLAFTSALQPSAFRTARRAERVEMVGRVV